jgi:DnaJ-class molecular chaperone
VQPLWKKPQGFYIDSLEAELKRMGTIASVLTLNGRSDRDQGVAVWFSRTGKEDFSWRETLGITIAYPTIEEVSSAYKKLAAKYHPDNLQSGDVNIFHRIKLAQRDAENWVNRREGNQFDYAIGADAFKDARLNIAALANSIKHIRGLERCGTSAIMEKTFEGFKQLSEGANVQYATAS